jgi:hypothetical protein
MQFSAHNAFLLKIQIHTFYYVRVRMIKATVNNISALSWRLVVLARKPENPEKTADPPQITDKPIT